EQQIIQDTVRKFAAEEIRPHMRELEKARGGPDGLRKKFHELGPRLLDVPPAFGGRGLGRHRPTLVHVQRGCRRPEPRGGAGGVGGRVRCGSWAATGSAREWWPGSRRSSPSWARLRIAKSGRCQRAGSRRWLSRQRGASSSPASRVSSSTAAWPT